MRITSDRPARPTARQAALAFRRPRLNAVPTKDYVRAAEVYARFKAEGRRDALLATGQELGQSRSTTYRWIRKGQELAEGEG